MSVFVICPVCIGPSVVILWKAPRSRVNVDWFATASVETSTPSNLLSDTGWEIAEVIPAYREKSAPAHTPPDVARIFVQASSAHRREELDGAAILFRKTLEIATKGLAPSEPGNLQKRIDKLAVSGVIPDTVGQWAHEIRIVGNEAAHDSKEPDKNEVAEIAEFTEAFLEYVYTMAEKYKSRQSRKRAKEAEKKA